MASRIDSIVIEVGRTCSRLALIAHQISCHQNHSKLLWYFTEASHSACAQKALFETKKLWPCISCHTRKTAACTMMSGYFRIRHIRYVCTELVNLQPSLLFIYNRQFGILLSIRYHGKRKKGSSSHGLHPSSPFQLKASTTSYYQCL